MENRLNFFPRKWKYCLFVLLVLLQIQITYGQQTAENNELRKTLDFMFERLDKKAVPTGLLRDFAVEEEDLDLYTGKVELTDKNKVSIVRYAGLLSTIQSAALLSNPVEGFESTVRYALRSRAANEIRLSVLSFDYAQIKADALTSGLISYTNGQVQNVSSASSPYQIGKVFAACCLDYATDDKEVSFILPRNYILSNNDCTDLFIDYGNGFVPLSPDKPVNAVLKEGENPLLIKMKFSNGETLLSHTYIVVRSQLADSRVGTLEMPDVTYSVPGTSYNGVSTSAKVSVKYGTGHTAITKPFIFVEGFDPRCLNPKEDGNWNFGMFCEEYKDQVDQLCNKGYDIVYVDWDKSEEYIQANAYTLIEVIKKINSLKQGTESNVLMGHSMGGLIARYALKTMENRSEKHEVGTYISYDAPHLGAHIPLGVLYGFNGIMSFIQSHNILDAIIESLADVDLSKYIQYGESLAYSTAAQQMLVYYVDPAGLFNNSVHIAWQQELNVLGFPKGDSGKTLNMLAVSNGNYSNPYIPPQTYLSTQFQAESDILHLVPWLSSTLIGLCLNDIVAALLNVLPGRTSIEGTFEIYPAKSYNQQVTHINMKYKKKFLWIVPISKTVFSYDRYFSQGYLFETYPCSVFKLSDKIAGSVSSGANGGIPIVGEFAFDVCMHSSIPFIPVSSALAYGDGLTGSSSYFTTVPAADDIPFGENYYAKSVANHATLTDGAFQWIISRLSTMITGPNVGANGTQYALSGTIGSVAWSTSDSKVATINQQGVLSVKGKGIISVIATCGSVKYSKQILVGMPRFVLSASHEPGGYKVNASCIDSEYAGRLSDLNDAIRFSWGVKFPNSDIKWIETESQDVLVQLEEGNTEVVVFLKITDKLGNSVTTQSVKVTSQDIYVASNQKLYIASNGNMYNEAFGYYSYELGRIHFDYAPEIADKYKELEWAPMSGDVFSPFIEPRHIPVGSSGPEIKDVLTQSEFDYIKNGSEENTAYTYMLVLYNYEGLAIQYFPIVFIYKEKVE